MIILGQLLVVWLIIWLCTGVNVLRPHKIRFTGSLLPLFELTQTPAEEKEKK
jgi:hypothetical protein